MAKKKSEGKKAKAAEKKQKAEKKGAKKEKSKKTEDLDLEDADLDAVLAEYAKKQEQFLKVTESPCEPPKPRSSSTLIASPANSNELFLFGGEYFNGSLATFFNDLYVYSIDRDEWKIVTSPNTPLPRSGHAWCRGGNTGGVYLFGGEFSSPKQGTFYHYNDFWRLEPSTREWTRVETKGKGPPARSGHRLTYYKNYIILFGGFQDTSQQTKYLSDLWLYDTQNFVWYTPDLKSAMQKPDPRSSFSFLPNDSGAVLYGGYSRVKATVLGQKMKGGGQSQRNILKPLVHEDCFFLKITQPPSDAAPNTPPTVKWERRKKPANAPSPARAGATMAYHKGRGIAFGGVHDVEEDEEGIDSEFFNTLNAWNIDRNRYFGLTLRKPRNVKPKAALQERGGRRGRGQANEEELLRNLAALETGRSIADADLMELDLPKEEEDEEKDKIVKPVAMEMPHPRFNAQLAVQDDVLYAYGGTFEKGDREYTFDEMYAIDLGKLDGVKEIFRREVENWVGDSDDEDSEDDEDGSDGDDDEDEEEDEEDKDANGYIKIDAPKETKSTPSTRKSRKTKAENEASTPASTERASSPESSSDPQPPEPEDTQPQPRPFESRRDFFVRTSHDWQEILMTQLRWKAMQPESLSVKEIKTRAFELSEVKWWDCREEVQRLEDEQEEAGIGEVVMLGDKGGSAGAGSAGGKRR